MLDNTRLNDFGCRVDYTSDGAARPEYGPLPVTPINRIQPAAFKWTWKLVEVTTAVLGPTSGLILSADCQA